MRLAPAACAILLAAVVATAGETRPPLRISTSVAGAPASPAIGDLLVVEIDVRGDGGGSVRIETPPDFGDFEPAGQPEVVTREDDGGPAHTIVRLPVRAFATGAVRAPTLRLVSTRDGATIAVTSPQTSISIVPLTDTTTSPAASKLVLPRSNSTPLIPAVMGGVVVAALGYRTVRRLAGRPAPGELALLVAAVRRLGGARRSAPSDGEPSRAIARSAADAALAEIASLVEASRTRFDADALYERLGLAAVKYVDATSALASRERTSAELLHAIRKRSSARFVSGVERVLAACDAVKFAREPASSDEFRRVASELSSLVRATVEEASDA